MREGERGREGERERRERERERERKREEFKPYIHRHRRAGDEPASEQARARACGHAGWYGLAVWWEGVGAGGATSGGGQGGLCFVCLFVCECALRTHAYYRFHSAYARPLAGVRTCVRVSVRARVRERRERVRCYSTGTPSNLNIRILSIGLVQMVDVSHHVDVNQRATARVSTSSSLYGYATDS